MKKAVATLFSFLSVAAVAASNFSVGDGKIPDFSKYKRLKVGLANHGREVKSDYASLPGYVIHWFSDGAVQTNRLVHIDCVVQTNTVEQKLDQMASTIAAQFASLTNEAAKYLSLSNKAAATSIMLDAARSAIGDEVKRLEEDIAKYEEYKTKYPLLEPLWSLFADGAKERVESLHAFAE